MTTAAAPRPCFPGPSRSPEKQQDLGVRVATVEKTPWTYTLKLRGKVAVDETRTYRLNAFSEGFIRKYTTTPPAVLVRKE